MKGIGKINQEIMKDAKKEANKIMKEAQSKVDGLRENSKEGIKALKKEAGGKVERLIDLETNRIASSAEMRIKQMELDSNEKLIQEVIDGMNVDLTKLQKGAATRYVSALERFIDEGISELRKGNLELVTNSASKTALKKAASKSKLSVGGAEEMLGGVIIRREDGTQQVDNSFERRAERFEDSLRSVIAENLFGGKSDTN